MPGAMVCDISPVGGAREAQATTVGGGKPLHRFIRGEPKSLGTVMVILGGSMFLMSIPLSQNSRPYSAEGVNTFLGGIMFAVCGVMYVLTERNLSKKMVTISLALSIVCILCLAFVLIESYSNIYYYCLRTSHLYQPDYLDSHLYTTTTSPPPTTHLDPTSNPALLAPPSLPPPPPPPPPQTQICSLQVVLLCHTVVGTVILIVMTTLARAALRSSKTQAVVVMHHLPSEE